MHSKRGANAEQVQCILQSQLERKKEDNPPTPLRGGKARKASKTSIDIGWQLSEKGRAYAQAKGFDNRHIDERAEAFKNYALAHDKQYANWDAAWQNWITARFVSPPTKQINGHESMKDIRAREWREVLAQAGEYIDEQERCDEVRQKLCGLFPQGAASDPKMFFSALVELFEGYPSHVVERAVDVRRGLICRHQFLPSLAEVRKFCEDIVVHERSIDRATQKYIPAPPIDRSGRPTYAELKDRFGPNWGIGDEYGTAKQTPEQARKRLIDEFGKAAFDSVPYAGRDKNFAPISEKAKCRTEA